MKPMKKKTVLWLLLIAGMLLAFAACGTRQTGKPAEDPVFTRDGLKLTIPAEYADLLVVATPEYDAEGDGYVLFRVSEKASMEAAKALDAEEDLGAGELFSIIRRSEKEAHEMLCYDLSGVEMIGRDTAEQYYFVCRPTDVRLVRLENIEEGTKQWEALNAWADSVPRRFVEENAGLTAQTRGNSLLEMYLNRIAYLPETNYTLSTAAFGPLDGDGFDASAYVEKLLDGVTYEAVDQKAPDGECTVLELSEDFIRFDFFLTDGGESYIRQVWNDNRNEQFYKASGVDGAVRTGEVVRDWFDELAAFTAQKWEQTADDLVGRWVEQSARRGVIEITKGERAGEYRVEVSRPTGDHQKAVWTMNAKAPDLSEGRIAYTDARMTIRTYASEAAFTEEVKYENGIGSFCLAGDNEIIWQDDQDVAMDTCVFVRAD